MFFLSKTSEIFGIFHKSLSFLIALILTSYRLVLSQLRLQFFLRRDRVIQVFSESYFTSKQKEQRVLIVITHIVQESEAKSAEIGSKKIERLSQTINGVLSSFAQHDLKIIINTLPNKNIVSFLPAYIREKVIVQESKVEDPMLAGYYAQELMIEAKNSFDWFLFLEDDAVIRDSCMLEKIAFFNTHFQVNDILMPNRYEMCDGVKHYIDITFDASGKPGLVWNGLSTVEIGGIKFSECQNAHGAMYCLNQKQLQQWIDSGRYWRNKMVSTGPLESAATFCLFECFNLYKPHYSNLHFLEVLHYDVKYSKIGHSQPQC